MARSCDPSTDAVAMGLQLYQASELNGTQTRKGFAPDGTFFGYSWAQLSQCDRRFAYSMGLPVNQEIIDGQAFIPPKQDVFPWIVDNGCYSVVLDTGSFQIAAQDFNPRYPLAFPHTLYGIPNTTRAMNAARYGQAMLAASKGIGTMIGATVTVAVALQTLANAGLGTISVLAGTIAAEIAGTAAGLGALASTGVGAIAAAAEAAMLAIMMGAVAAFPAEGTTLHVTSLNDGVPITIAFQEAGKPWRTVCLDGDFVPTDPNDWPQLAQITNVDADTFFAGLVYLRARARLSASGGITWLDLAWTQRASDAAIAGFRAARTGGASVSDALIAARDYPPILTPLQVALSAFIPGNPLPGNPEATDRLIQAHQANERDAQKALAAYDPGSKFGLLQAAGLPRPRLTQAARAIVQGINFGQGRQGTLVRLATASPALRQAAKRIAAQQPTRTPRSLTTGPAPHPAAVLGSGALCGVAGYYLAPAEYRLPAAGAAAVVGLLLTRFIH